eukprot:gene6184-2800_t
MLWRAKPPVPLVADLALQLHGRSATSSASVPLITLVAYCRLAWPEKYKSAKKYNSMVNVPAHQGADSAEIKARKQAKMSSNPNYHSHQRVAAPFPGPGGMRGGNYHQQPSLLNGQYAAPGGADPSQQHLYLEDPNQSFPGHGNHPGGTGGRPGLAQGGQGAGYPGGGMPIGNGGGHMMGGFGGVAGGGGYGMGAGNAQGMAQPVSLYIKNLPLEGDKLMLYEKFSPFGAILSLLTDDHGVSKGVGFVNYADPMSASKAVAALHNLPMGERHLHVAFQAPRSK